jgi:hypothetical protein
MAQPDHTPGLHFQMSLKEWHAAYKARKALAADSSPENSSPPEDQPVRVRISRRRREQLRQRKPRLGV